MMYSIYIVHFSLGEGVRKKNTFYTLAKKLKIVDHHLSSWFINLEGYLSSRVRRLLMHNPLEQL